MLAEQTRSRHTHNADEDNPGTPRPLRRPLLCKKKKHNTISCKFLQNLPLRSIEQKVRCIS